MDQVQFDQRQGLLQGRQGGAGDDFGIDSDSMFIMGNWTSDDDFSRWLEENTSFSPAIIDQILQNLGEPYWRTGTDPVPIRFPDIQIEDTFRHSVEIEVGDGTSVARAVNMTRVDFIQFKVWLLNSFDIPENRDWILKASIGGVLQIQRRLPRRGVAIGSTELKLNASKLAGAQTILFELDYATTAPGTLVTVTVT